MPLGPTYSNNPDCPCLGHRVPGVKHIMACCGKPHVDDMIDEVIIPGLITVHRRPPRRPSAQPPEFFKEGEFPKKRVPKSDKNAWCEDGTPRFPHCDQRVLHAPGVCEFCDLHPEWQWLRQQWNINFTGEANPNKLQCPAEAARPLSTIQRWHGNVPETAGTKAARDEYFAELDRVTAKLLDEKHAQESLDSCEGIDSSKTR